MSHGVFNWTFRDVTDFLRSHGFTLTHVEGGHYYLSGRHTESTEDRSSSFSRIKGHQAENTQRHHSSVRYSQTAMVVIATMCILLWLPSILNAPMAEVSRS